MEGVRKDARLLGYGGRPEGRPSLGLWRASGRTPVSWAMEGVRKDARLLGYGGRPEGRPSLDGLWRASGRTPVSRRAMEGVRKDARLSTGYGGRPEGRPSLDGLWRAATAASLLELPHADAGRDIAAHPHAHAVRRQDARRARDVAMSDRFSLLRLLTLRVLRRQFSRLAGDRAKKCDRERESEASFESHEPPHQDAAPERSLGQIPKA